MSLPLSLDHLKSSSFRANAGGWICMSNGENCCCWEGQASLALLQQPLTITGSIQGLAALRAFASNYA